MTLPYLVRKPSYTGSMIDRPRLYDRLDLWQEARVIVIQAPAGYGKSSLVSRWLDVSGLADRSAWLSLDEVHCDLGELLRDIAHALNSLVPGLLDTMQPVLDSLRSNPERKMQKLLATLWDGFEPSSGASDNHSLLVLDDVHLIDGSEAGSLLAPLLERAPPGLHFVLLTRHASFLPSTRLYASGDVVDLTAADLRFTADEVRQYLLSHDYAPSPEELAQIVKRTEGWVVALQLALHSRRRPGSLVAYLESLRGDSQLLARYLAEEVLAQQSPALRAFLLRTSILDSFSVSLATAVADVDDAYRLLAELQRNELFLIPMDTDGKWFRYHHLFQELLKHRLTEVEGKAAINRLHRRAAGWLAGHERLLPAIHHLLEAGDADEAAELVESHIRSAILQNPVRAQQLFDALPLDVAQRRPRLMLERCLISLTYANRDLTLQVDNAQRCLTGHPSSQPLQAVYEAELLLYRAAARHIEGDLESAAVLAQQVQSHRDKLDRLLTGASEFLQMRLGACVADKAIQQSHAMRALAAFDSVNFAIGQIAVRRELAMMDIRAGRSAKASREFESIALDFDNDPLRPRPEMEWVYAYAAEHSYRQHQLDQAMRYIEAAMEIATIFQNDEMVNALICFRNLCAFRRQQSKTFDQPSTAAGESFERYRFIDWQIRWLLAIDRTEEAWEIARHYRTGLAADFTSLSYFRAIPYLRAYVARGVELEVIQPLLNNAFEDSVRANDLPQQLELLALRAWQELQTGQEDTARKTLSRAEDLVAETGYVRVLLDIPALAARTSTALRPDEQVALVSPVEVNQLLTDQEQAVLVLLADERTYAQIAETLVISINTVRTHVRHVYKKLGVHRRDPAIQRAQKLGLLTAEPE